jgi:nucleoside-diphosphate-sugar epimerase
MPRAFVTGGTGFVGGCVVEVLVEAGWEVVALHRKSSDIKHLRSLGVQLAQGDVADRKAVFAGIPDAVDGVFHVAADTSFWSRNDKRQMRTNVDGTQNVVDAAIESSATRFVHTSSIGAFGFHASPIDENTRSQAEESGINYFRSKHRGELVVLDAIERGLDPVILNLCNVVGRLDRRQWGRLVMELDGGRYPAATSGAGSFGHAVEVARAHLTAFERGRKGERYLLGGTNADYVEVVKLVSALVGRGSRVQRLPAPVTRAIGRAWHLASYITRREPELSPQSARLLTTRMLCGSEKAQRELGYRCRPLTEMFEDCHAWLRDEGLLRASG